ncbi:PspA/IM30 family protein [Nostoc sp. FACHB-280]|uniref:PspA/IM30 family protein n=1 Tax=Nostoc sp. FACHB-280 TaxID=2692839 RepID=UPI00168AA9FE|nr:PspA/IM30 family protein [Nostoc sp. FACHB-280]MBD2496131.1 PspA/IM30 family protein [Nostoc sp. FACHB-280]
MGLSKRINSIVRSQINSTLGNFKKVDFQNAEKAAFIGGGVVAGAVISETVGGMGLAGAGTAIGIGMPHLLAVGAVTGTAVYGAKKGIENRDSLALGAAALGAAGGIGVSSTIGNMGLLAAGTGFSIGMVPVTAAGTVVGLGAYGLFKLLDGENHSNGSKPIIESLNEVKQSIIVNIHTAKANQNRLQADYQQTQNKVASCHQIALLALKKGNEDLAREALMRKYTYQQTADSINKQLAELTKTVNSLLLDLQFIEQMIIQIKADAE